MKLEFTIIFKESDGAYHAFIPEVPGVISCGATIEEAREYVLDALAVMLKFRRDQAMTGSDACLKEKLLLEAAVVSETAA